MNGNYIQKKSMGDYQTPYYFAKEVCNFIKSRQQFCPDIIIEPNCGHGNFLLAAQECFNNSKLFGFDINENYICSAQKKLSHTDAVFRCNDLLHNNLKQYIPFHEEKQILIIGNPPWVNNATLSLLESNNLPKKTNFKQFKGINSKMGDSNFDICESMILSLIDDFQSSNTLLALLCKTSVARNVFQEIHKNNTRCSYVKIFEIQAKKIFGVSVNACLFLISLTSKNHRVNKCKVFCFEYPENMLYEFGFINDKYYADIHSRYLDIDGNSCFEWRQGIKHDCSQIMELSKENSLYKNKQNILLDIEDTLVYPLIKGSSIKYPIITNTNKYIIITQKKPKENTIHIQKNTPKTWEYLNKNLDIFRLRKSIIYENTPPFSIFGIGEYAFKKYKVGISGFSKSPLFCLSYLDKPVMFDDTCYFLSFDNFNMAYTTMLLLNSITVKSFLLSICFLDSKRPYTKKILQRIDFQKAVSIISYEELLATEKALKLPHLITTSIYNEFGNYLSNTLQKTLF